MVRAIFDFCPSVSEELPLFVGDVIEVLAVVDEFWLLGKKEDVTGKRYSFHTRPLAPSALSSFCAHPSLALACEESFCHCPISPYGFLVEAG